jgi:predicted nucleotidyltransferase
MRDLSPQVDTELHLDAIPALPQSQTIRELATRLWQDKHIRAIWLGGSFAAGTADQYSDIDLRVAVLPADLSSWERPDLDALVGAPPLARQFLRFGDNSFLHHLILPNGDILDLLVQGAEVAPDVEPTLTLGCRDEALARLIAASNHALPVAPTPVASDDVRAIVISFWVNSHKHRKVLYRNLDLMFPAATYYNWRLLMRLWYIAATGNDVSERHFTGIHGLTELTQAVERVFGSEALALCGAPTRTRAEICAAIERYQDTIAQLGRSLAARYHFEYPADLEAVARRDWRDFRADTESATPRS